MSMLKQDQQDFIQVLIIFSLVDESFLWNRAIQTVLFNVKLSSPEHNHKHTVKSMVEELRVVPTLASAMSLELSGRPPGWQNVPTHRTCCNCETYGWTFDKQEVQQCQRCKGVTYCSKVSTTNLYDH